MRAIRYHGREDVRLENIPEPSPQPGEVKLRVLYNGICGSDLHEYYHGPMMTLTRPHPLTGVQNPAVLGHEFSGEVVELGKGVDDLKVGDLIAVEPIQTCGTCHWCRAGQYNHCPTPAIHGYSRDGGGLAEFTVVLRAMAHKLPGGVSARHGALVEPMAVSYHAVARAHPKAGQTFVVHGGGPIGVGAFLALRAIGDIQVVISEPSPARRAILSRLGAERLLDPSSGNVVEAIRDLTGGRGADGSIDAAGVPPAFKAALASTAPMGHLVVVAMHMEPFQFNALSLLAGEVNITGAKTYCNDYPAVIDLMTRGAYPLDGWVTTIPLEGFLDRGIVPLSHQQATKIMVDIAAADAR
ncbi:MAG TPA: 2,3-butanediol dehydrogenase [Candidatus Binataceae bacterium]|jgi:(R,R)-butanediol dehydrogenase/meso-butanediol dehydrogenase/diacetyl reductase|nr:2,3-butanediol dehydrogenase [Candidatus Binataceae bacterium]